MGVFEDYVNAYDDLWEGYLASGTPNYEDYVYENDDLWNAYASSGPPDFAQYVYDYPDLLAAFNASDSDDIEQWGASHWSRYGQGERRNLPTNPTQTVSEWGKQHWDSYGKREGREMPRDYALDVEQWGQQHWQNYGQKEDRILFGPKIGVDANGKAYVANENMIGAQARKRYQDLVTAFNNASEGSYKSLMESIRGRLGDFAFEDLLNNDGEIALSEAYKTNLSAWDPATGAQPPTGGFDAAYYRNFTDGGLDAETQWDSAQESVDLGDGYVLPDLDITGKYSFDTFMHWHYTTQGKAAGYRGNEEEYADLADAYEEYLTDAEYEMYRDKVLGAEEETILSKEVSTELLGKDKRIKQQFGSMTTEALKEAAGELVKAKQKERDLDFYMGLEGFGEVLTLNESIANSLMGDTGIGGIMGFVTNPSKAQESLEKSLEKVTGIPSFNGVTYNWQKWFEEQLTDKYAEGIEIEDPANPGQMVKLDADFAKRYIDEYLKPRFDSSKSMSEFISTLDVQQRGEDILKTETALTKLKDIAEIRAQAYLDDAYMRDPLNFNVDFYMNPTGNFTVDDPKVAKYAKQKEQVAADWETAKKNGSSLVPGTKWTWDQWAYYYGLDVNNRDQFAQLHYQVVGAGEGFDPARDVLTLKDATDYISTKIIPEIAEKDLDLADVNFLQFVTPEEFADSVIEGVSPEENKAEWDKMLSSLGIAGSGMGVDEVKQFISDQFRTGNAVQIRQSIKYLNEKGKTPTQKELGVDYIARPEDDKPATSPYATTLYKIFKDAGYQGNEDDFYDNFMTDVDRGEMELMERASSEKGLELGGVFAGLTSDDPLTAFGSISKLFTDGTESTSSADEEKSSYFKLIEDDEEPTKSKSAEKILGEFTSLFKGFS